MPADDLAGYTMLGELALDGSIARVGGVLPAAVSAVDCIFMKSISA